MGSVVHTIARRAPVPDVMGCCGPRAVCRPVATMVGPVPLERPYFSCRPCRLGCYPSDEALGVVAGCQQRARHKAAAKWVTEVPYDTAQSLFGDLTGVSFGSARMHTMTNLVAEGLTGVDVAPSREASTRRVTAVAAGRWGGAGHRWGLCADASRECPGAAGGTRAHTGQAGAVAGPVA